MCVCLMARWIESFRAELCLSTSHAPIFQLWYQMAAFVVQDERDRVVSGSFLTDMIEYAPHFYRRLFLVVAPEAIFFKPVFPKSASCRHHEWFRTVPTTVSGNDGSIYCAWLIGCGP